MKKNQKTRKTDTTRPTATQSVPPPSQPIGIEIVQAVDTIENYVVTKREFETLFYTLDELDEEIDAIADGGESWSHTFTRLLVFLEQVYRTVPEIRGEGVRRITLTFPENGGTR